MTWRPIALSSTVASRGMVTKSLRPTLGLLRDRLWQALNRIEQPGEKLAVIFIDIDGFGLINDTLGHVVGDVLLADVARRIRGCIPESDAVVRIGGDEFAVILTGLKKPE